MKIHSSSASANGRRTTLPKATQQYFATDNTALSDVMCNCCVCWLGFAADKGNCMYIILQRLYADPVPIMCRKVVRRDAITVQSVTNSTLTISLSGWPDSAPAFDLQRLR